MAKIGKNLSLISGLVAIGNIAYEKYDNLEELNNNLTQDRQTNFRKNIPEIELLSKYTPLYKKACEKHDLLDVELGKEWKSRASGLKDQSITISSLFEIIDSNSDKPATAPSISYDNE